MKILIISGTHGNEMSAVQVGIQLNNYYKHDNNVTVVPMLNESGIRNNSREVQTYQEATKDLNRSFKEEEISYTDTIKKVKELIAQHDFIIDIHNSPRCSNFCLIDAGKKEQEITNLISASGVKYASRFSTGGTIKDYCNRIGKTGITYEFSGMTTLNNKEYCEIAENDIKNIINKINENDNNIVKSDIKRIENLYTLTEGFLDFYSDINSIAMPGDILFSVICPDGEVLETVKNEHNYAMEIIAIGHSYQTIGSSVLQYIRKEI